MANGNSTVKIEILGDSSGAEKALKSVSEAADKASQDLEKSLPSGENNPIKKFAKDSEEGGNLLKTAVGTAIGVFAGVELKESIGKVKEAFGGFADGAAELGQATFKMSQETGLAAEPASALISIFERYGVSGDDASKSLGNLSKQIEGSALTAQGLKGGLSASSDRLKQLGIDVLDTSGKTRPLNDILLDVADKMKEMPDGAEKTAIAMQLFGKSGKDMLPILSEGGDAMKEMEADAKKLGLTLTGDNVAQVRAYGFAQKDMGEALAGVKLQLGVALMPLLSQLMIYISKGAVAFNQEILPAIKVFAATVTANLLPVLKTLGEFFSKTLLPGLESLFQKIKGPLGSAFAIIRDNLITFVEALQGKWTDAPGIVGLTVKFGQFGLFIRDTLIPAIKNLATWVQGTMIPALGNMADYVQKNVIPKVKEFADFLINVAWPQVQHFLAEMIQAWQDMAPKVLNTIQAVVGFIQDHATQIKAILAAAWAYLQETIKNATDIIKGIVSVFLDTISGNWSGVWKDIRGILSAEWDQMKTILSTAGALLGNIINAIMQHIDSDWSTHWAAIQQVVSTVWNAISTIISTVWGAISSVISIAVTALRPLISGVLSLIQGDMQVAWDAIKGIVSALWDQISLVVKTAINLVRDTIHLVQDLIHGDWQKAWDDVKAILDTVWGLIKGTVENGLNLVRTLLTAAWGLISNEVTTVWNTIKGEIDRLLGLVKTAITTPITEAGTLLGTTWDAISTKATTVWNALKKVFDDGKQGLKDTLLWPYTEMRDAISGIMGAVETNAKGPINAVIGGLNKLGEAVAGAERWIGDKLDIGSLKNAAWPTLPAFATGVKNFSGGYAIVGEEGPELVKLPAGSDVMPNSETMALMHAKSQHLTGFGAGPLDLGKSIVNGAKNAIGDAYASVSAIASKGAEWILGQAFHVDSLTMPGAFSGVGSGLASTAKDGLLELIKGALSGITDIGGTLGGSANFPGGNAILDMARQTQGLFMLCEKFVGDVMQRLGLRYARAGSAEEHAHMQPLNPGYGPAGAIQFFPDSSGYGHVGFSLGDGSHIYSTISGGNQTGVMHDGATPYGWTVNPAANGAYVNKPTLLLSGEGGDREGEITSPVQMMRKVIQEELQASSLKAPHITQHITGMMPGQVTIETKKALRSMVLERRLA
jgi:phage-related protein